MGFPVRSGHSSWEWCKEGVSFPAGGELGNFGFQPLAFIPVQAGNNVQFHNTAGTGSHFHLGFMPARHLLHAVKLPVCKFSLWVAIERVVIDQLQYGVPGLCCVPD